VIEIRRKRQYQMSFEIKKRPKIGLALGGGAARGIAHIGVLKAFVKAGVPVDLIAGTSSGAIVGALFASGLTIKEIEETGRDISWIKDIITPVWPHDGLLSGEKIANFIEKNLPVKTFSQLKIPLSITSVDIKTKKAYIFHKGRVSLAVQASCSVPGIFSPVKLRHMLLVDGGVLINLPGKIVTDMGANITVGVDVNRKAKTFENFNNIFKVLLQSHLIMMEANVTNGRHCCNYILEPDIGGRGFLALDKFDEFIELGEKAAIPVIKKIKAFYEDRE
jgi:NTE family protein